VSKNKQRTAPRRGGTAPSAPPPRHRKPLVFISHHTRNADLAEAFANLLRDASGGMLKSFRSSNRKPVTGIEFGAEWYQTIMERLNDATDVVALLTPHSVDRPWILYEAGVAAGKLNTKVFGLAIGVPLSKTNVGPFAQFLNSEDDEDSMTQLVLQLIARNHDAEPSEAAVRMHVKAFRDAQLLDPRPDTTEPATAPELDANAIAKLFEEVKVMFRQLPEQMEQTLERRLAARGPSSFRMADLEMLGALYGELVKATIGDTRGWDILASLANDKLSVIYGDVLTLRGAWGRGEHKSIQRAMDKLYAHTDRINKEIEPATPAERLFANSVARVIKNAIVRLDKKLFNKTDKALAPGTTPEWDEND
jgi:hypothetical protein